MAMKREHQFEEGRMGERRTTISPINQRDRSIPIATSSSPRQYPVNHGQSTYDQASGPSNPSPQSFAFPSPTRPSSGPSLGTSISPTSRIPHRVSLPVTRARRSSPLLHEIQPPSRRLSSHQMLLLTPFGGTLPPGALPMGGPHTATTGAMGMSRGSSSMGRNPPLPRALPMVSNPSNLAPPLSRSHPTRTRHLSLMNPTAGPSPLASAPMTTIPSASEHGSSSGPGSAAPSREASEQSIEAERMPSLVGGIPATVPMTRSNSLPVMTLRELQALSQKDGELGIARGGGWAWVEGGMYEDIPEDEVSPRGSLSTSVSTSSSTTPPAYKSSLSPFTAFKDPFAPASSSMAREAPNVPHTYQPAATEPGYHYSPTQNDSRRMSEANTTIHASPASTVGRRPSAPLQSLFNSRTSLASMAETITPTLPGASSLGPSPRASVAVDPGVVSLRNTSPVRPRITRYKSLPGRHEGLGLQIVVKPQTSTSGPPTTGPTSAGTDRRSSEASVRLPGRKMSIKPRVSGSWAAIELVDSLAASELASSTRSSFSSTRGSITSTSPTTVTPALENLFMVEEITSRAHLAEFGALNDFAIASKGKARERFESVDSAMPTPTVASGFVAQLAQSGWNATFPRRGSLAVLTRTALGPWAVDNEMGGLGVGDKDRVSGAAQHWSERRGSWAEGWSKP